MVDYMNLTDGEVQVRDDTFKEAEESITSLELDLDTCQNDLEAMTQMRDALANALEDAIGQLDELRGVISFADLQLVLSQNS